MKKKMIVCLAAILTFGLSAGADDLLAPDWRGLPGTTYQVWDFLHPDRTPLPDPGSFNPYGDTLLKVDTPYDWREGDQRRGIWPLSGELDIFLPNRPLPDEKLMRIQLTWMPGHLDPEPFMPDIPIVGITPFADLAMEVVGSHNLPGGWEHTTVDVVMHPNPPAEWITIKGDILVDQLVIDTYCVPEPMTVALLSLGALGVLRRRK